MNAKEKIERIIECECRNIEIRLRTDEKGMAVLPYQAEIQINTQCGVDVLIGDGRVLEIGIGGRYTRDIAPDEEKETVDEIAERLNAQQRLVTNLRKQYTYSIAKIQVIADEYIKNEYGN